MNKKFFKIFFLIIAIIIIIVLFLPKKTKKDSEIKVLKFEVYEGEIEVNQEIILLVTLENTKGLEVDTIVINNKQIDKSSFLINSTTGRIYLHYVLTDSDFNDEDSLYLVLESVFLNDSKINVNKTIYLRPTI